MVLQHSVQTTLNCLSAVRRFHLNSQIELPTPTSNFQLREAIRGARRYLSRPTIQKLPIYPSLLSALVGGTAWGSPMRCLYLTLWFTFSRLASIIPTDPNSNFCRDAHLSWADIVFYPSSVRIILSKTKTIQCRERSLQFLIPAHPNQSICLLTQLKSLFLQTPFKAPSDPVFVSCQSGTWSPLSRRSADPVFKAALATLGVNPTSFGWSSFRRGGATTGFIATQDVESLREHGDWKSNAYTRYLALPASQRTHIVQALQSSLS